MSWLRRDTAWVIAIVTMLTLGWAACGGARGRGAGAPIALTVAAIDGGEIDLASHRGKIVVLHVFATWSLEAQADVLALNEMSRRGDVVVIGVALDLDGRILVAPWRKASGVTYLVALADEDFRAGRTALGKFDIVPTTIVIDRAGRVRARVERSLSDGELADLVRRAANDQ